MMDGQGRMQVAAHAVQGEAALVVGRRRPGPGRKVVGVRPPEIDPIEAAPTPAGACGDSREIDVTESVTPGTGRPCRSNSRPWITCSGRSVMSAVG